MRLPWFDFSYKRETLWSAVASVSATPLWIPINRWPDQLKAPSPLRFAGALQKVGPNRKAGRDSLRVRDRLLKTLAALGY